MRASPESGPEQGKVFIVVRVLYGLKAANAAFRAFIVKKLDEIGYQSNPADPDVCGRHTSNIYGPYVYILENMEGDTVKYKNGCSADNERPRQQG